MKRILFIFALLLVVLNIWSLDLLFTPSGIQVNQLSTFSFDPVNPQSQPLLTTLRLTNDQMEQKVKLRVELSWNNNEIIGPNDAIFISIQNLAPGQVLQMSNRELITNTDNQYFKPDGSININIVDLIEDLATLEEAILSGYFPDGKMELKVSAWPELNPADVAYASFTITIRNAGAINLISPGALIGQNVPSLSDLPVSFIWNSVNTGFNTQTLVVREYPPNNPPSLSNIHSTGTEVFRSEGVVSSGFSEYLPLNGDYYYAWQVFTDRYDEYNPNVSRNGYQDNPYASSWFVFRYKADEGGDQSPEDVQAILTMLKNPALLNLINMGYTPTGEVIYEGRTYRGQDAIDILNSLIGKEIEVKVRD